MKHWIIKLEAQDVGKVSAFRSGRGLCDMGAVFQGEAASRIRGKLKSTATCRTFHSSVLDGSRFHHASPQPTSSPIKARLFERVCLKDTHPCTSHFLGVGMYGCGEHGDHGLWRFTWSYDWSMMKPRMWDGSTFCWFPRRAQSTMPRLIYLAHGANLLQNTRGTTPTFTKPELDALKPQKHGTHSPNQDASISLFNLTDYSTVF